MASFARLALKLMLLYLVECRVIVWLFTTMGSYFCFVSLKLATVENLNSTTEFQFCHNYAIET